MVVGEVAVRESQLALATTGTISYNYPVRKLKKLV